LRDLCYPTIVTRTGAKSGVCATSTLASLLAIVGLLWACLPSAAPRATHEPRGGAVASSEERPSSRTPLTKDATCARAEPILTGGAARLLDRDRNVPTEDVTPRHQGASRATHDPPRRSFSKAFALGAMVITQREITLSTVAALLTITGYSINDTVVIYDRIRENLPRHRGMSFSQIINLSISETLGRTIITSGVTALSLVAFLWWGTGLLKDFAFTLLVGMLAGTFSTIYVAAPLTEWIDRRFFAGKMGKVKAPSRKKAERRPDAVV